MPLDPKVIRDIYGEQQSLTNPFPGVNDYNPDQVAEGLKLGRAKGFDGLLAAENLPQLREEEDGDKWDAIVKNSPNLAKKMQEPAFAAVAKDDTENLGIIDGLLNFGRQSGESIKAGLFGSNEGYYGSAQAFTEVAAKGLDPLVGTVLPVNPIRVMAQSAFDSRQIEKQKVDAIEQARGNMGPTERAVQSGIQSAVQTMLTLPLAILTRNPNAMTVPMSGAVMGQSYGDARDKGLPMSTAIPFAASQGMIEYATEQIPALKLIDSLNVKSPLLQTAKDFLAREIPGEQVATLLQDLNEWAVMHPEKPFADYLAERPDAAYQTLVATVVGGSIQVGTAKAIDAVASRFAGDQVKVADAEQHRNVLAQINDMVAQSKVRARDPETFKQFVASAAEVGPVQEVYIPAEVLAQSGVDVVANLSLETQASYAQALESGGSVQIPLEEFLTNVAGTEIGQSVIDHVKLDPDGMTFAESQEFQTAYQESFNAQVSIATQDAQVDETFKASTGEVKALLKDQLTQAGRTSQSVNDAYATMASSYYAVRAAQLGITPKEMYDRMPLRVVGEGMTGGLDQANAQVQTPEFKNWFKKSQVVDDAGKPITMYHGTNSKFDTFDYTKIGKNGTAEGSGFYFTSNKDIASGYGDPMEVYLSIQKPLAYDAKPFSRRTVRDLVQRIAELESEETGMEIGDGFLSNFGDVNYSGLNTVIREATDLIIDDETALDQISGIIHSGVNIETVNRAVYEITGYDGVKANGFSNEGKDPIYVAFFREQIKSATNNNGNFDPKDPNVFNQFAGPNANTAILSALDEAEKLEAKGSSNEMIRRQTGWFKGADDKWRFEISDEDAKFIEGDKTEATRKDLEATHGDKVNVSQTDTGMFKAALFEGAPDYLAAFGRTEQDAKNNLFVHLAKRVASASNGKVEDFDKGYYLETILDHPKLFEAYPFLQNMRVEFKDMGPGNRGAHYPGRNLIEISQTKDKEQMLSTLLHEIQHAIQYREGFASGGNTDTDFTDAIKGSIQRLADKTQQWVKDWESRNADLIASKEKAAEVFRYALKYDSAQKLIAHANRDKPSSVFRNIRNEMQWIYGEDFRGNEKAQELQRAFYSIPKPHKTRERNAYLSDMAFNAAQVLLADIPNDIKQQFKDDPRTQKGMLNALEREVDRARAKLEPLDKLKNINRSATNVESKYKYKGSYDIYRALAGEVEARNTQARQKLTDEERRNTPPQRTADVAASDTIVIFGGLEIQAPVSMSTGGTLEQQNRGSYSPIDNTISLLKTADISTFLHEMGHAFLSMDVQVATDLLAMPEDQRPPNSDQIIADAKTLFDWFGMPGTIEQQVADWNALSIDAQRDAHEKFAEGFEAYLFQGKAPSLELQPIFQRFRAWLSNVYRNLKDYLTDAGETLTPEVTAVMDRMLATPDRIKEAEAVRNLAPLFSDPSVAEMSDEQYQQYQRDVLQASQDAIAELEHKSMRDMTWTSNLRAKTINRLNKEAAALRREVRMQARSEVLQEPIYKAWQFLTRRMTEDDKLPKGQSNKTQPLDPSVDTMLEAMAKLGGLNKAEAVSNYGVDPKDKTDAGIFGKPLWRKDGGLPLATMAELLAEQGYLSQDENGKYEAHEFEEKLMSELRGDPVYSVAYVYEDPNALPFDVNALSAGRLTRNEVARYTDDKTLAKFENRKMLRVEGLPADVVAEMFGFEAGEDLIKQLAMANPPSVEIEALTDSLMFDQHAELSSPEAIAKAADEAIHNDVRTRVLATELAGLQKALGSIRTLARMAKEYANGVVGNTRVDKLRPNKFATDAAKSGKLADQAMRKGQREEAITHKRNQLVNHAVVKAAYEAQAEATKILQRFRKITSAKTDNLKSTHNMDLVNVTRAILSSYGIGTPGQSPIEYVELIKSYDPELYAAVQPEIITAVQNAKDAKALTVDELRALRDQVESLWYLARRDKQVEIDGKMVDRDQVANELAMRLEELGLPDNVPGETHAPTEKDKARRTLMGYRAALRRVESWISRMDSGDVKGVFRRYVFTPVSEAADNYRKDSTKYIKRFRDLVKTIEPSLEARRIAAPELGYTFGYSKGDAGMSELLHAILHTGNESNKRKMLLGRGWATDQDGVLDTTKWDTFIARMIDEGVITKEHYDFVQGIWDLLEDTKPLAQRTHREVFGRYFAEVTANEFNTPFGVYRGGYVPAITDSFEVQDAEINQSMDAINQANVYMFPSTSRGFTKSRVEYNKPLALDLRLLPQHLDKVLLFSHLERPIRDVQKILKRSQGTLNRYDPVAYTDMLLPWLNRAAKQVVQTPSTGAAGRAIDKFFSAARSRAGMATMFANLTNALQQVTGFSITLLKVRPTLLRQALSQYIKNPSEMAEAAKNLSPFMADRLEHQSFHLRGEIEDMLLNPSKYDQVKNWTTKNAYFLQSTFQNIVDTVSWSAAYNQSLADGNTEADAIRYANSVVRETQGSLQPEDISRFEAGTAFTRLFTQFASYFNMQANAMGSEFSILSQELGLRKGAGRAFYILLFGFLTPAWVSEAIVQGMRGGMGDGDDEYLDEWLAFFFGAPARNAAAMVPIVGQFAVRASAGFTVARYDDRMSTAPSISVVESAVSSPASVYEAIVNGGRAKPAIRDVLSLITMTTGIPVSPLAKPIGYLAEQAQGNVEPTGPIDMARGLVTGVASPESRQ